MEQEHDYHRERGPKRGWSPSKGTIIVFAAVGILWTACGCSFWYWVAKVAG